MDFQEVTTYQALDCLFLLHPASLQCHESLVLWLLTLLETSTQDLSILFQLSTSLCLTAYLLDHGLDNGSCPLMPWVSTAHASDLRCWKNLEPFKGMLSLQETHFAATKIPQLKFKHFNQIFLTSGEKKKYGVLIAFQDSLQFQLHKEVAGPNDPRSFPYPHLRC